MRLLALILTFSLAIVSGFTSANINDISQIFFGSRDRKVDAGDLYIGLEGMNNSCGSFGRMAQASELNSMLGWCDSLTPWEQFKVDGGAGQVWTARNAHSCELRPGGETERPSLCFPTEWSNELSKPTSIDQLYLVDGLSCDVGRMVTLAELAPYKNLPNFCGTPWQPPALFGVETALVVEDGDNKKLFYPAMHCTDLPLNEADIEDALQAGMVKAACFAEPKPYQVHAFSDTHSSNGGALGGRPKIVVNRNISANGSFRSFKVGEGVEVHTYSGKNLSGQTQVLTESTAATGFEVQSLVVRLIDQPTPPPESEQPENEHPRGPVSIDFTNAIDNGTCRVSLATPVDLSGEDVRVTLTLVDKKGVPYNITSVRCNGRSGRMARDTRRTDRFKG